MLKAISIAVAVVILAVGIFHFVVPIYEKQNDPLTQALDQLQSGLTYDKFVNMTEEQKNALVSKMPQQTINLIMNEAKKFPTTVSENLQDMASNISNGSKSIVFSKQGSFEGLGDHNATGKAEIISVSNISFLSFQDFQVTNGPDLHVYMTKGGDITSAIDVGKLKGSIGNQNYALNGVDTKVYDTVVIYSPTFHVYFAQAILS